MVRILYTLLLLFLITNATFSQQKADTRKLIEETYRLIDSCSIVDSNEYYITIKYDNRNEYYSFVFKDDSYVNLIITIDGATFKDNCDYLRRNGFKEDERRRVWYFNDKVAYILWSFTMKQWYITVYPNKHIKKI